MPVFLNKNKFILLFLSFIFFQCLTFSLFTDNRWEDWYITYRASKNLAIGNGLVFNVGQHLQTFTSPLGTLIPASLKYVFIKFSNNDKLTDEWVVWAFRLVSCLTLMGALFLLLKALSQYYQRNRFIIAFTGLSIGSSILIIIYTINGMETAFMLLFMSLLLYVLIDWPANRFTLLTMSYAGIMYTRPDGFIYAGSIIAGFILIHIKEGRWAKIKDLIKPVLPAIIAYTPWLIFTYFYYGTIVPHTIVAKGNLRHYDLSNVVSNFIYFNTRWHDAYALPFMPPYYYFGGWGKYHIILVAKIIGTISSLYWLNLYGNSVGRACSFAVYLIHLYLYLLSGQQEMPWYLPNLTFISLVVLSIAFWDFGLVLEKLVHNKSLIYVLACVCFTFFIVTYYYGGVEWKYQQSIVDNGNRTKVGEWLKANALPGETLFLEPLGYVGFYSGLKTYDFPGMSSPEVVQAIKTLHTKEFIPLIKYLRPTWLALTPTDAPGDSVLKYYNLAKVFDVSGKVDSTPVPLGKNYLSDYQIMSVYKIKPEFSN